MKPAAIFFDAVGTLLLPAPPFDEVYEEVSRRFGGRQSAEEIHRRFKAAFARQEAVDKRSGWVTSEERETRRWRDIVAEVLDDVTDGPAAFAALYEHFARPEAWQLDPAAERVMAALSERGFRLGLASNYDARLHRVLKGWPFFKRLDWIVISSEVGWRKPAAEFFAHLARVTSLSPAAILHVGDDGTNDYQGAMAAGLQAVLFDPANRRGDFTGWKLRELSDLVGAICKR
jgi:putative hydrolase of the HAD superfamily